MRDKASLLAEDNRNDEKLTLRSFKKANVVNRVVVVRDGVVKIFNWAL